MLEIVPIEAFSDNYIWLLQQPGEPRVAVVDPGDAQPVLSHLQAHGLQLAAILVTHKHRDHIGGIAQLQENFPGLEVYGPANEPIGELTHRLGEGDRLELPWLGVAFEIMELPGHTEGHLGYHGAAENLLFCGDTLFAAGCGRVFSGTFDQLHHSLQRIATLPAETRLYCAHEYTLDNLGFADWVEPGSQALASRRVEDEAARARGEPTVPSLLAGERATNPFLRTADPQVIAAAEAYANSKLADGAAVFRALRTWKDREYD